MAQRPDTTRIENEPLTEEPVVADINAGSQNQANVMPQTAADALIEAGVIAPTDASESHGAFGGDMRGDLYSASAASLHKGDRTDRLNADELAAGWIEMEQRVPEYHVTLRVGAKTDLGTIRENNEDKFDMLEPTDAGFLASKGRFYGVADGMGGHSAGQIASELALKTVLQRYYRDPSPHIIDSMRQAIAEANTLVYETAQLIPERQGMGTTLTIAIVREDRVTVAHVGDSRMYLLRGGEARQMTHDHSLVAEQVRLGSMTAEDAANSPLRNIILRSIGTGPNVVADFYEERLQDGDMMVLCSDGLTGHVAGEEIEQLAASPEARKRGPSVAAFRLIELANSRGGRDNVTVIVAEVMSVGPFTEVNADPALVEPDHAIFEGSPAIPPEPTFDL